MLLKYFDENSSVQLKFELDLSNVTEVVGPKGPSASVKFNKVFFRMEDWCTLMTLPLSEVERPMGVKFTSYNLIIGSIRTTRRTNTMKEKHDFKGKTNMRIWRRSMAKRKARDKKVLEDSGENS